MTDAAPLGLVHGGELTDFTKSIAMPLHLGNRTTAAQAVIEHLEIRDRNGALSIAKNDEQANIYLGVFLQYLLDHNRYADAAALLWPATLFSSEPSSVREIWDAIFQNVAVAVPGASSMGKSYNLGVWCYLDWRRDPFYTSVQIVGPSEDHLERNLFSHLAKLHRESSIPGPGELIQLGLTLDAVQRSSGIFGLVVPTGKKAAGRLQGVKVTPRKEPHPQFGKMSRLRVFLEEAELIPIGIWDDTVNILSNAKGVEQFKIFAPFNPKDRNCPCAQRVEPEGGWASIDLETSYRWKSKRGWQVVRLDAFKSENVVSGQELYPGLQTKEGLALSIQNAGGVGTANYYTFARGWYPVQGVDLAVIPQHLTNDLYGTFEFVETPQNIAGVDVALEGGDNAIFALGRLGLASGWRKPPENGKQQPLQVFKDQYGNSVRREVVQLDQIFTLPKGDTLKLVNEIKRVCAGAYVRGEGLGVDRTGNGAGVHDLLVNTFSPAVKGVNGSSSPTERRITEEDQKLPCDEYRDLLSEVWFALRKFTEFGFLKVNPQVPSDPLIGEMTGRLFLLSSAKTKVESKKDYKSRGHKSPDRADALTILVHVARLLMSGAPSVTGTVARDDNYQGEYEPRVGITDRNDYL